jgi:hypothetical protein
MNTIKNIIIAFSLIFVISSCSKEEDEILLADPGVNSSQFDAGYLGIQLKGSNTMVDSIVYTNTTKGFSFNLLPSQIAFVQGDTLGFLSKPLLSGNKGDNVSCCIYVNTQTMLGVSFKSINDIPLDSVPVGTFCLTGTY